MKVINIYGSPCSGKSTTAAGLFYFMKLQGLNVELVTEYAKDLVWQERLASMMQRQEYIFAKQNHRLDILREKVDYAIIDSPLLLSTIYPPINETQHNTPRIQAAALFYKYVEEIYHSYDNTDFYLFKTEDVGYQEVGRERSATQAVEIDTAIRKKLVTVNPQHYRIAVNETTVSDILEILGLDPLVVKTTLS